MWPNPKETADLVTFTEEILNGKLHFLCCEIGLKRLTKNVYDKDMSVANKPVCLRKDISDQVFQKKNCFHPGYFRYRGLNIQGNDHVE